MDAEKRKPVRVGVGQYGCYYYPRVPCETLSDADMRKLDRRGMHGSKVQIRSKDTECEIKNVQKIHREISSHVMYYVTPVRICSLSVTDDVRDCDVLFEDDKHPPSDEPALQGGRQAAEDREFDVSSFDYGTSSRWINMLIPHVNDSMYIDEYIKTQPHTNRWTTFLRLYRHLVAGVVHLGRAGILHWDLHIENILVRRRTGIPYIIDFGLSVDAHEAENRRYAGRFRVQPHLSRWPIETQLVMWARSFGLQGVEHTTGDAAEAASLSDTIGMVCDNMRFLEMCTDDFRQKYIAGTRRFYEGFTAEHGRSDVPWLGWPTWDNYALSTLFLQLTCMLYSPGIPVNNPMFGEIFQLLMQNVHYDWRARHSAEETLRLIDVAIRAESKEPADMVEAREYPSIRGACSDM